MKPGISDLWRWDGTVDRGTYALIGVLGFAIKHNLDRFVASFGFRRQWGLFNYWIPPTKAVRITSLSPEDAAFLTTMLALALPFIWVGVALTLRRLRAVRLPTWLVAVFFLPLVNLAFFALLSVLPSAPAEGSPQPPRKRFLDRLIPDHPAGSAAMALLLTLPFGVAMSMLGASFFGRYGWGLFVALPFSLGLGSVLLDGYPRPRSFGRCLLVSSLSVMLLGLALLALAIEGVICLAMALPIGLTLAIIGGSIGYLIQRRPWSSSEVPATTMVLVALLPALMGAEYVSPPEALRLEVRTAMDIAASPEEVWRNLVSFPELPAPTEWLFRHGVAYPIQSSVQGRGVGALRQCQFSTGTFVEPVEVWDEPRLLKFSVSAQPPTMQEWTPYAEIQPPHLQGYLHPEGAEFRLTALPRGTRLEGTSWYRNQMWPAAYWRLWSDLIIHRIHARVFRHIKNLSERGL